MPALAQAHKRCRVCGSEKPLAAFNRNAKSRDGRDSLCRDCNRQRQREYRRLNPQKQREWEERNREASKAKHVQRKRRWLAENREKHLAHVAVSKAVKRGTITRPDACERCGRNGRVEAHHRDYSRRFDVQWLCGSCHRLTHSEERDQALGEQHGD